MGAPAGMLLVWGGVAPVPGVNTGDPDDSDPRQTSPKVTDDNGGRMAAWSR